MYGEGADPRNATLKDTVTVSGKGLLIMHELATNTVRLADDGEIAIGVSAAESSRGEDQALETSGATVAYYPLGGVLMVQSEASQTYTTGLKVYVGASGQCIDSNDHTSKLLGLYVGEGASSVAAGTLIPVMTAGADIE